tara:strand:+ start:276 stop:701 length:426 start_codon:yes stop_codon:yes gene_type:complete
MIDSYLKKVNDKLPDFNGSNWLIRIPLAIVFIQQGFSKLPFNPNSAESYGLPVIIWLFVIICELLAGFGLLFGGILRTLGFLRLFGDFLTRFSGTIVVVIISGVIIVSKPDSFIEVLLYDHFHIILYCAGLFFALRGNRAK